MLESPGPAMEGQRTSLREESTGDGSGNGAYHLIPIIFLKFMEHLLLCPRHLIKYL